MKIVATLLFSFIVIGCVGCGSAPTKATIESQLILAPEVPYLPGNGLRVQDIRDNPDLLDLEIWKPYLEEMDDSLNQWESRPIKACDTYDDPRVYCCLAVDLETNRSVAVPTVLGKCGELVIFGPNKYKYPYLFIVNGAGEIVEVIVGEIWYCRPPPYPSCVPAYFFPLPRRERKAKEALYMLPFCPEGRFAEILPSHAGEGKPGHAPLVKDVPSIGYAWVFPE